MSDGIEYELTRVRLRDGWETTVYLVRHPLATTSPRVIWFPEPQRPRSTTSRSRPHGPRSVHACNSTAVSASPRVRSSKTIPPATCCRPGLSRCSDITIERHPRCALGIGATELLAVCCDGRRSGVDGGLTLGEPESRPVVTALVFD